jgi:acyl-CoA synthetase (AMP-forming)/AMP-acid ligase II
VPKPDHNLVPEELKSSLKSRLSPFKVPKNYYTVSELPKSPAGKILKRQIRNQHSDGTRERRGSVKM